MRKTASEGFVLADTDVVIDFLNGHEPVASVLERLMIEHRLVVSAVSVFELRAGVSGKKRLAAIDRLTAFVPVVPIGLKEASVAAEVYTGLKERGELIGNSDLLIASTALVNGFSVFTRNRRHFERVRGLALTD